MTEQPPPGELVEMYRRNPDLARANGYEPAAPAPRRRQTPATVPAVSEHDMQASLFDWAVQVQGQIPELEWLHAVPNGQYRRGQRPEPGLRAGVPDVMLPVMRYSKRTKTFHGGLYLELKVTGNTTTPEQERWLRYLQEAGYVVAVVHDDWRRAANAILAYLGHDWNLNTDEEAA